MLPVATYTAHLGKQLQLMLYGSNAQTDLFKASENDDIPECCMPQWLLVTSSAFSLSAGHDMVLQT